MEQQKKFPEQDEPIKKHGDSSEDPRNEGHVKEWEDRARVVLDVKEAVQNTASPRQSPLEDGIEDVEEKSENIEKERGKEASY